jgi:hypothetical protein
LLQTICIFILSAIDTSQRTSDLLPVSFHKNSPAAVRADFILGLISITRPFATGSVFIKNKRQKGGEHLPATLITNKGRRKK